MRTSAAPSTRRALLGWAGGVLAFGLAAAFAPGVEPMDVSTGSGRVGDAIATTTTAPVGDDEAADGGVPDADAAGTAPAPDPSVAGPVAVTGGDDDEPGAGPDRQGPTLTVTWGPEDLGPLVPWPDPLPGPDGSAGLPPGTIRVVVVDETGAPYRGACVMLWAFPAGNVTGPAGTPERVREGETGADGAFTASFDLTQVPPDYPPDFPPLVVVNVRSCSVPPAFDHNGGILEPGIQQQVTVQVTRTANLQGRVLLDGAPVAGQCIVGWTITPDPGGPEISGPGIVSGDGVSISRVTTGADGSFRLTGLAPGRPANVVVAEGCTGPAWDISAAPDGEWWPADLGGGRVVAATTALGPPGSTTTTDLHVRAIGDRRADAPTMTEPFYGIDTYLATRSGDDPVPSCRPDAVGPSVWRRAAHSGPVVGFMIETDRPVVVAAFEESAAGLVEVACAVVESGELRSAWALPPSALVFVQGIGGTTRGRFTHHAF